MPTMTISYTIIIGHLQEPSYYCLYLCMVVVFTYIFIIINFMFCMIYSVATIWSPMQLKLYISIYKNYHIAFRLEYHSRINIMEHKHCCQSPILLQLLRCN